MRVLERVAEFLGLISRRQLAHEQALHELKQEQTEMSVTTQAVLAAVLAQGAQIKQLVADRDAKEQADLDQINTLLAQNTAMLTAALTPAAPVDQGGGTSAGDTTSSTATVTVPAQAGSTTLSVSTDTPPVTGSTVTSSNGAVPAGTTVQDGSTADSIVLSNGTTADHTGGETLTITPPAAPVDTAAQAQTTG